MIGAIIGTLAVVLVTVMIGMWIDRKVPVLPKPPEPKQLTPSHGIGEAPSTALRVRKDGLDKLRSSQRCPLCRAAMTSASDDRIRYDDADLLVCNFQCTACNGKRTLYVSTR